MRWSSVDLRKLLRSAAAPNRASRMDHAAPTHGGEGSFFDLPYGDRQLILFVDLEVLEAEAQARTAAERARRTSTAQAFIDTFSQVLRLTNPVNELFEMAVSLIDSYHKAKHDGVNVTLVGKDQVTSFQLPPGHPRHRVLYAGHPASAPTYVPVADFHRFTFEHKFSEVVSLLMHLGAKTLQVEHVMGWGTEFTGKLSAGVSVVDVQAQAGRNSESGRTILYKAEFEGGNEPGLPPNLVWYPHEATWQQVAQGRLKFGLLKFSLSLQYKDDYSINAALKTKVGKTGLDLGGGFEEHQATTWQISGEFR